ncbi:MAG: hypothetical protein U0269_14050 [Polyangiales bacterium]
MTKALSVTARSSLMALLAAGAIAACNRTDHAAPRPTQAALSTALPSVSASATPAELEARRHAQASEQAPTMQMQGGSLAVRSDEDHVDAHSTRVRDGYAVSWGDKAHQRAFMLLTDAQGEVRGTPALVRQAVSEEEEVYPPDVVATGNGFAVAWTDPSNGRVRFARLDANRRPVGRASIVHDGLESPRVARIASGNNEHGVAVQLDQGVYFARVSSDGTRIGEGALLAEETAITAIDRVQATPSGYEVSWRESSGAVRTATVARDGRVALRTLSDPSRVAMR